MIVSPPVQILGGVYPHCPIVIDALAVSACKTQNTLCTGHCMSVLTGHLSGLCMVDYSGIHTVFSLSLSGFIKMKIK